VCGAGAGADPDLGDGGPQLAQVPDRYGHAPPDAGGGVEVSPRPRGRGHVRGRHGSGVGRRRGLPEVSITYTVKHINYIFSEDFKLVDMVSNNAFTKL
jgi:hypothetical protein